MLSVVYVQWCHNHSFQLARLYATFDSNQAKLTTNTNPTTDKDIRYAIGRIDVKKKKQYNKSRKSSRKTARYIPYNKIGNKNVDYVNKELEELYGGFDNCVADGIAIECGNKVYIVDSGKEDGKIRFGFRKAKSIVNEQFRKEFINYENRKSLSKGYISDELSNKFESQFGEFTGRNMRRELGEELRLDSSESQDNEGRVSDENANRRGEGLRYSLKDSEGNTLTAEQRDYFKDSKVVDTDGNI